MKFDKFELVSTNYTYESTIGNTGISGQDPITINFTWDTNRIELIDPNRENSHFNLEIETCKVERVTESDRFSIKSVNYNYNANKGTGSILIRLVTEKDNNPDSTGSGSIKSENLTLRVTLELHVYGWTDFQQYITEVTIKADQLIGEVQIEEGESPEAPKDNEAAENGEFSDVNLKKESSELKPRSGKKIKIPDWVIYNIIANKQGFYKLMSDYLPKLVSLPVQLAELGIGLLVPKMNLASLWDGSQPGVGTMLGSCQGTYERQLEKLKESRHPDQYVIKLEEPTTVSKFGLKGGIVGNYSYTTRVIQGKPREDLLNLVYTKFEECITNVLNLLLNYLTFTSEADDPKLFGTIINEFLDNYLKKQGETYVLYLEDDWKQFIYERSDLYINLIDNLLDLEVELDRNKELGKVNTNNKPTADNVAMRTQFRTYERDMITARDLFGITPFNLTKSEIFKQEYLNTEMGNDIMQKFNAFMIKSEAIIEKVPKDIQDTINSVIEPMGAVVVTAIGPGSVATNAVQIAGQLKRTKDALHKLKTEVQEPIDLAMAIGIPPIYYSPLTAISKLLAPF